MSLSPSSIVAVQIPGRAPVDYFEPVVGGAKERRGGLGGPLRWREAGKEQSGEEFENGRRQTAAQCTRKRVLPLFPVQTVFLSLIGHFTFPQTEKRVRQWRRRRSKEKERQIRIVSFRPPPPPPCFNCPSSHQPLAFLISRSWRCHTRTGSQKPGSR